MVPFLGVVGEGEEIWNGWKRRGEGSIHCTLGCPKKTKSPNFGTQLTPMVFIGWMNRQKKFQHYRPISAIVQAIFSFTL